jgi:hypothetical protein
VTNVRGHAVSATEYLDPNVGTGLPVRDLPVVELDHPAVAELAIVFEGDGRDVEVPIVPWPHHDGRPLDPGTGIGGGVAEGIFRCTWRGDRLMAVNEAVAGAYVLGFATAPEDAGDERDEPVEYVHLWHVNHHPDGGQLFAPLDGRPFLVPAIPPGPDPDLDRAVVIRSDGSRGVCLRPGVWHDGVYPESGNGEYLTRQGAIHARVSCDIGAEFGCLLRFPLGGPPPG